MRSVKHYYVHVWLYLKANSRSLGEGGLRFGISPTLSFARSPANGVGKKTDNKITISAHVRDHRLPDLRCQI